MHKLIEKQTFRKVVVHCNVKDFKNQGYVQSVTISILDELSESAVLNQGNIGRQIVLQDLINGRCCRKPTDASKKPRGNRTWSKSFQNYFDEQLDPQLRTSEEVLSVVARLDLSESTR